MLKKIKFLIVIVITLTMMFVVYKLLKPTEITIQSGGGYSIKLVDQTETTFHIDQNQENEVNWEIYFENKGPDSTFMLSILINYEQVEFIVDEDLAEMKNYEFHVSTNEDKNIKVSLSSEDFIYRENDVLINVIAGSKTYASDINKVTKDFGIIARYNVINDNSFVANDNIVPSEINESNLFNLEGGGFSGISLNQDFDEINQFFEPNSQINVASGERINLAIRAGGFPQVEEYIVILFLDHNPININNSSYFYFKLNNGNVMFHKITLDALIDKGRYEVYGYLIPNPWSEIDSNNMVNYFVHPSQRFTINVE